MIRTTFAFITAMTALATLLAALLAPIYAGRSVEAFVGGFLVATAVQYAAGVEIWRRLRRLVRDG